MKIATSIGYWSAGPPDGAADVFEAADRLRLDQVWTAEAYGSDAWTPLAWWGSRTSHVHLGDDMLESSDVVAFAAATDLPRARVFYEQKLGLPMVGQNDLACVFDANGTMLRVTAVSEVARAGYTVLGWRVTDIEAAVQGLVARGVVFSRYDGMDQDENGVWTTPGGEKVAWFTDPDGNTLSLTQFL